MKIKLICVGSKMPSWITEGYNKYEERLPGECKLELHEIAMGKRTEKGNIKKLQEKEGTLMLSAAGKNDHLVALEVRGKPWSSDQLANELQKWLSMGRNVSLLVGGPEGMLPFVSKAASQQWSLSPLTLPHPLVRLIIAEQIYRAWSILTNHPYHR